MITRFYVVGQGWKDTVELATGDLIESDEQERVAVVTVVLLCWLLSVLQSR